MQGTCGAAGASLHIFLPIRHWTASGKIFCRIYSDIGPERINTEWFPTLCRCESFLSCMSHLVSEEAPLSTELFPTLCTCEWFLSCMSHLVSEETALNCELIPTLCTCEWFFSCMSHLVYEEVALNTELFPTL
ncbi:hypothetical protein FKM82_023371 [Ascaphus truei]